MEEQYTVTFTFTKEEKAAFRAWQKSYADFMASPKEPTPADIDAVSYKNIKAHIKDKFGVYTFDPEIKVLVNAIDPAHAYGVKMAILAAAGGGGGPAKKQAKKRSIHDVMTQDGVAEPVPPEFMDGDGAAAAGN